MRSDDLFRKLYLQRPEPTIRQCAHKRRFPNRDQDDRCLNIAEFGIVTPNVSPDGVVEPVCGQCLAPVVKMLLRRYENIAIVKAF